VDIQITHTKEYPMPAYAYAAINSRRSCRVAGCSRTRYGISPYCRRHHRGNTNHGHPEGRRIEAKHYTYEKKLVDAFLEKHAAHEGLQSALRWLDRWLHQASVGEAVPGQREIARLAEHRVTPKAILSEACAVFLFSRWAARRLPDDDRLTFALGTAVLSLMPREKRYGYSQGKPFYRCVPLRKVARREIGCRIRNVLLPLLLNVALGIEAEREEQKKDALALHVPFTTSATTKE
jgi:hypothetical protein